MRGAVGLWGGVGGVGGQNCTDRWRHSPTLQLSLPIPALNTLTITQHSHSLNDDHCDYFSSQYVKIWKPCNNLFSLVSKVRLDIMSQQDRLIDQKTSSGENPGWQGHHHDQSMLMRV